MSNNELTGYCVGCYAGGVTFFGTVFYSGIVFLWPLILG